MDTIGLAQRKRNGLRPASRLVDKPNSKTRVVRGPEDHPATFAEVDAGTKAYVSAGLFG